MKGVLFDFWGTLVENGIHPSPLKQVKYTLRVQTGFSDFVVRFEDVFMTKNYEDLYEAFEAVCKEFEVEPTKPILDRLVGTWNKNGMLCKPFPETIQLLEDLKKDGYKLCLISNTPSNIVSVLEKFDMSKYFDAEILSCNVGLLKTDTKMFDLALKELKLKKEEVVMVGDSLHTDIKGAEDAGIMPILVDRRDGREYKNKVTSLEQVKEFLK